MWLARQQKRDAAEIAGSVGQVTLGGDTPAVELDSERRNLEVYAPGGYRWRPAPGQKVLVLKANGVPCVTGTPSPGGLEPGEVSLESTGGAGIRLDNQGKVNVTGTLTLDGMELTALVRDLVAQETQKMLRQVL